MSVRSPIWVSPPDSVRPTVFVVDDDPGARESVCALVETMGVAVRSFESAEAFLDAYDESRPGCVVTDLRMAGMTGLDLLERISSLEQRLPVILVTAYANVPLTVRALQNGAVTLLEKPCGNQELWDAIADALARDADARAEAVKLREIRVRIDKLSAEEREVMQLIVAGASNKVIARRQHVGLRTIENRRRSVFQKMGTQSLPELVRLVFAAESKDTAPIAVV